MPKRAAPLSNDPDFVRYTKYSKKLGKMPEMLSHPPPDWRPIDINNPHKHGMPRIPEGVDKASLIQLFDLFFDAEVLEMIAHHTNQHVEKLRNDAPEQPYARGWKSTSRAELYTYFAIIVYMAIHREPSLDEYWSKLHKNAPTHKVNNFIAKNH
ncbi:hypothetical protein BU23DRAFT_625144 [Bimuria novae-zelandiae CBS 107.79]|uniref:PiggyBac transposable element-derived protein domain-containing protein n=1 Tax=Bimuria novae-zelandiae CBS 107.79 TaxID=1447943 RepID=A0A6A5VR02_9PLEO|nr:hypothetical protein BU23DRAFT_625144 [Bimuria novae-zelandiae CBS 107.79]